MNTIEYGHLDRTTVTFRVTLRPQGVENLLTIGNIDGVGDRPQQTQKMLTGLAEWSGRQSVTKLNKNTEDRDVCAGR